jgi:hypothetical protein
MFRHDLGLEAQKYAFDLRNFPYLQKAKNQNVHCPVTDEQHKPKAHPSAVDTVLKVNI